MTLSRATVWKTLRKTLAIAFFLAALPVLGQAKPAPWQITADSLIHYKEPQAIFAEGNVILTRPEDAGPEPLVIKADWVRYDMERGLIKARGHVSIHSADEDVTAQAAKLNLETDTGTLQDATIFLVANQLYIKGKEVEKTGEWTYTVLDGWASACRPTDGGKPAWAITSKETRLTVDGMARLKHAFLNVKEVPILYTPYMTFPAKTKRETGFLFPEWSHSSRDGFGLMAPFFINLSPSSDITLYPNYLTNRGMMYGGEFRYVAAERSLGTFLFSYLRDRLEDTADDEYGSDGLIRTAKNRYWLRGKADQDFGNGLVGHLDLDFVSDQDFLLEFDSGSLGYEKNNENFERTFGRGLQDKTLTDRESSAQLVKSWSNMALSGEVHIVQDVRSDTRKSGDTFVSIPAPATTPLQALPRVDFNGRTPLADLPVSVAWDTEYVNYWRDRGVGAHRLDLHPQLITPLPRGGFFEGTVTGGVRETMYQVEPHGDAVWAFDKFQDRTAFDFEGNLATLLMRDFNVALGSMDWLEHTVRPNLIYSYVTRTQEKELPSLDSVDRLAMKNWLTYELNNYFAAGGTDSEGELWNRNLGYFKALQTYNVREARRTLQGPDDKRRVLSDIRFDLDTHPLENLQVRYQTNLSVYGQGVTRYELTGSYADRRGDSLSVDYRYLKHSGMADPYFYTTSGDSQHDIETRVNARLTETLLLRAYVNKSFSTDRTVESSVGFVYKPYCWMMEFDVSRSFGEQRVMLIFTLDGIGRAFRWGKGNV